MMNKELIQNRIDNFWGYGSLDAPVWFVGIEERFDKEKFGVEMLEEQFKYAEANIDNGILDASRSKISEWKHLANMEPFLPYGKPQSTWRLPIALYLYFSNKTYPTKESILDFQRNVLADGDKKEVATIELSSLPAFSTNDWSFYDKYEILELRSRKEYERYYLPRRAEQLGELVKLHKPKLVIFYSSNKSSHLPRWREVIGDELETVTDHDKRLAMYFAQTVDTSFCVIPQPTAGVSYDELYEYADRVKDRIDL